MKEKKKKEKKGGKGKHPDRTRFSTQTDIC